jgi:hypothetical protein
MATELEALVGYLFVVDGRAISAASPGAVALPPPRRCARGRDHDTLFGLISITGDRRETAAFYEQLTDTLSQKYFATTGGVTSALREAINAVNAALIADNARRPTPVRVGFAGAVLRDEEVIICCVGPARCLLAGTGYAERLPTSEEWELGVDPLGVEDYPEIRFYRREVHADDLLVLTDESFNRLGEATLGQAVEPGGVEAVLGNLRRLAGEAATAVVIQFVAPLESDQEVLPPPPSPLRKPAGPSPLPTALPQPEAEAGSGPVMMARRTARGTMMGVATLANGLRELIGRMMPTPEDDVLAEHLNLSVTMQVGIALAVALIVAMLTAAVYLLRGQASQYSKLMGEAQTELEQARMGGQDQALARPHWETAVFLLDKAEEIRPGDPVVTELRSEAVMVLDAYDSVTRVELMPMREYPAGAYLRGPVLQGLDIYVIDTTADVLYRDTLNEDSTGLIDAEPQVIVRQGELIGDQPIGGLIDLVWMVEGGTPQRNVLTVLARNGLLITYSPSWAATATPLPGAEAWNDPRAVAIYQGNLYVLDAGANQIWRYVAEDNAYPNLPESYFTDFAPDLSTAIDMDVDSNGNVFVLDSAGSVLKFFNGRQEPFTLEGLPQPIARPTALHIDLNPFDPAFYITDPGAERIYATSLSGKFLHNYKASQGHTFVGLSGVFSDPDAGSVYFTAGNVLYRFTRR